MASTLVFLVLLLTINGCLAAKFAMIPMFGRSHYMVMAKLAEELTSRGHKVSILLGEDCTYAAGKPGVKLFQFPPDERVENQKLVHMMSSGQKAMTFLDVITGLMKLQQQYCDMFLGSREMMDEVRDADLIIGESLYPCGTLVADKFDLPHVAVNLGPVCTAMTRIFGVDPSPSYVPQLISGLSANSMSLKEKIKNFAYYLFHNIFFSEFIRLPMIKEVKDKYNIKPNKSIKETLATVDLVLLVSDFSIEVPQPLPPHVREVGLFMPSPAKPLPADLEEFMQSSGDDGVILVSFGSMIDTLHDEVLYVMNEAFAKLPQKVIWRIKLGSYKGQIAPNIKLVTWVPQNDILGHPKTKLFMTHSGMNGVSEAAYHGVPMVCSPFFGDQPDNSQRVKDRGMGEITSVRTTTTEELVNVLRKVLNEKSYKENALHVSKVMKMRKRTPTQEAADLIEYVHAVGSMSHLKPRGLDLPFYELYMLDVIFVIGIVLILVLAILIWLLKLVVKVCLGMTKKIKTA